MTNGMSCSIEDYDVSKGNQPDLQCWLDRYEATLLYCNGLVLCVCHVILRPFAPVSLGVALIQLPTFQKRATFCEPLKSAKSSLTMKATAKCEGVVDTEFSTYTSFD